MTFFCKCIHFIFVNWYTFYFAQGFTKRASKLESAGLYKQDWRAESVTEGCLGYRSESESAEDSYSGQLQTSKQLSMLLFPLLDSTTAKNYLPFALTALGQPNSHL